MGRISVEENTQKLEDIIRQRYGNEYLGGVFAVSCSGSAFDEAIKYLKEIQENDTEIMKKHWQKLMDYPEEFEMDEMYIDLEIVREAMRSVEHVKSYQDLFGTKGVRNTEK